MNIRLYCKENTFLFMQRNSIFSSTRYVNLDQGICYVEENNVGIQSSDYTQNFNKASSGY